MSNTPTYTPPTRLFGWTDVEDVWQAFFAGHNAPYFERIRMDDDLNHGALAKDLIAERDKIMKRKARAAEICDWLFLAVGFTTGVVIHQVIRAHDKAHDPLSWTVFLRWIPLFLFIVVGKVILVRHFRKSRPERLRQIEDSLARQAEFMEDFALLFKPKGGRLELSRMKQLTTLQEHVFESMVQQGMKLLRLEDKHADFRSQTGSWPTEVEEERSKLKERMLPLATELHLCMWKVEEVIAEAKHRLVHVKVS